MKRMKRYFLDRDSSSHWYLVPEENRAEWQAWTELDEDDERAWDAPEFAERINSSPSSVTFEKPRR